MTTISIPERNRAVKALLIATYGKEAGISVRAGNGTAYHWIEVAFKVTPDALRGPYGQVCDTIVALIRGAGLDVSTYCSDGDYTGDCLILTLARCQHDWQADETGAGLVDLCLKCGESRA